MTAGRPPFSAEQLIEMRENLIDARKSFDASTETRDWMPIFNAIQDCGAALDQCEAQARVIARLRETLVEGGWQSVDELDDFDELLRAEGLAHD